SIASPSNRRHPRSWPERRFALEGGSNDRFEDGFTRPRCSFHRNPRSTPFHTRSPTMTKRIFTVLGLGIFSLGLGACSHGMPTRPSYNQDPSALRSTSSDARVSTSAFDAADIHALSNVFTAAGDIRSTVIAYQQALGHLNPNAPGSQAGGRREINW